MLAFGMKSPVDKIPLKAPLKKMAEAERSAFVEDLDGWRERVRNTNFGSQSGAECRDDMLHYYKMAMQAAEIFQGKGLQIAFRWRDSFNREQLTSTYDFKFEAACALYNVAAATSLMATAEDRGSDDGMKRACGYFQEAAGLIDGVKELVKTGAWADLTPDMSISGLDALQFLMLAQAQKCFYEKASRAGMKDGIISKIAAECAGLYADASLKLHQARVGGAGSADWLEVVEWNKKLFEGMMHYYAATEHQEANEYGKQVSRLTHAVNRVAEAVLMSKKSPPALTEQFVRAHKLCADKQARAKKDNDMVYNERVPPVETLPAIWRKAMVKATYTTSIDVPPLPVVTRQPTPGEVSAVNEVMQHLAMSEAANAPAPPSQAPSAAAADPPPPSFDAAVDSSVQQLVQMGFSREAASEALAKTHGHVEQAAEMLLESS